jgi:glycosyltransferase involved in cell wall biosynthesis
MNKKILFISPYPKDKAPSQRLKYEQYYSIFNESGFQVFENSFMSLQLWAILYKKGFFFKKTVLTLAGYIRRYMLLFKIKNYDIIYVHLWGTPFGTTFYEQMLRKLSNKLVYDIDDMVFLKDTNEANKISKFIKGKSKSIYLMKVADHVITCTQKLDDFVKQFNPKTTNISSTLDTAKRYKAKEKYDFDNEIVLGWSGSYTTSKYLYLLSDVFKSLAEKLSFKLIVLGDPAFRIEGVRVEAIHWREELEIETLKKFDIGLYPLPDEPWVYGKSGLKAIQYMALGIPTIATGIGANFNIITDGDNGFLIPPNAYDLWEDRILELFNDGLLRSSIGRAGRRSIEEKYSLEQNKNKYLDVFRSLTNTP